MLQNNNLKSFYLYVLIGYLALLTSQLYGSSLMTIISYVLIAGIGLITLRSRIKYSTLIILFVILFYIAISMLNKDMDWIEYFCFILFLFSPILFSKFFYSYNLIYKISIIFCFTSFVYMFTTGFLSKNYVAGVAFSGRFIPIHLIIFSLLGILVAKKIKKATLVFYLSLIVNTISLLLSGSTTGVISILLLPVLYVCIKKSRNVLTFLLILIFCFSSVIVFPIIVTNIDSLPSSVLEFLNGRNLVWNSYLTLIWEKPFLGYGFLREQALAYNSYFREFGPHNGFINIIFRWGFFNLLLYAVITFGVMIKAFKQDKDNITLFCLASVIAIVILDMFEASLMARYNYYFPGLLLGIALSERNVVNTTKL